MMKICEWCHAEFNPPAKHKEQKTCSKQCAIDCMSIKNRKPLAERVASKIDKAGQVPKHCPELGCCWKWNGKKNKDGYGIIHKGRPEPMSATMLAHRASWVVLVGPIDVGLFVLHRCDNPECVNPAHLYLGAHAENAKDRVNHGRLLRGENVTGAKLTEEMVISIRAMVKSGESKSNIAKRFNVHRVTVFAVVSGKNWKHVIG